MDEKPLVWLGSSLRELRAFPEVARRRAGFELSLVQQGLLPSDWKPMPDVGAGVVEIRIHTGTEHRVFYVARFEEAVYVLHAFEKKTQKTARLDLELASSRLTELNRNRKDKRKGDRT
jgi:phage-related protein